MDYSIIGIDFGTSTTAVRVRNYIDGQPAAECLSVQFNGSRLVPTLVFRNEAGELFYGHDAVAMKRQMSQGTTLQNFKIMLLHQDRLEQAKELIEGFFQHLFQAYSEQKVNLGVRENVRTVISFPAKWTPDLRTIMKQCASKAGFPQVDGLDEPTAAIRQVLAPRMQLFAARGYFKAGGTANFLLIDMGAGTTDIAVFSVGLKDQHLHIDQIITYPTVDDPHLCGGREIDTALKQSLFNYLKDVFYGNETAAQKMVSDLSVIKAWKEFSVSPMLSRSGPIGLPANIMPLIEMFDGVGVQHKAVDFKWQRADFEAITRPHWQAWHDLLTGAIEKARQQITTISGPQDIDFIVATGGHSQWYGVKDFFLGKPFAGLPTIPFSKVHREPERFLQEERPQETVADGLTLDEQVVEINPVMGNSLWVRQSVEGVEGEFDEVIDSTTPIPGVVQRSVVIPIEASYFRTRDFTFTFDTAYGSTLETAVHKVKETTVDVPDDVFRFVFGIILGGPLSVIRFFAIVVFEGWDEAFRTYQAFFRGTYNLKLDTTYDIHTDGTVHITCEYCIDSGTKSSFTLDI